MTDPALAIALNEAARAIARARLLLDEPPAAPVALKAPAAPDRLLAGGLGGGFSLGPKSERELVGVHPRLVEVVKRAIQISSQDFTVYDGLRTQAEQRQLVANGASQTMDSKHLIQSDGVGHAVDLVPWINGKARWEWPAIYPIAVAMRRASQELGLPLTWGGCWDQPFDAFTPTVAGMEHAVEGYTARRKALGKKAFIDGPHYELRAS